MKKIYFDIKELKKNISKSKKKKKLVLCHGVFDLLHIGHIKHFQEAKKYGEILIVSVTPDRYVNKGPSKPAFTEKLRLESIAAIGIVDYIYLNDQKSAVNVIEEIKPNVYCKGIEYKNYKEDISGQIKQEVSVVKKVNAKIIFTKAITFSSSRLINQNSDFGVQHNANINNIKKNYNFKQIKDAIEKFKSNKILIIGETIIDQYVFCEALGKSGKEPVLVLRDLQTEEYLGGAAVISRHLSNFCNKISLLSMVGEKGEYLSKIKKELPNNVNFRYIKKKNSPTILKRRFLDKIGNHKVLGVYKINDDILENDEEKNFNKILKNLIPKFDLVIVSDYGHGLISKNSAKIICKLSKYLALNAQVNAANIGYHSLRNYKNIDSVIINSTELRHNLRDKNEKLEVLMKKMAKDQKIKKLVVTRGNQGSILYSSKENKTTYCLPYAKKTIDKIGAGDAMLSLMSLCLKAKLNNDFSLLFGSLAAAQSVETIGNRESVNKSLILKSLENMLK
jgi:rfaE bifunctional protein kinase chain/domain